MRGYIHKYVDASEFKKPAFSDELQAFFEAKIKPSNYINLKYKEITRTHSQTLN